MYDFPPNSQRSLGQLGVLQRLQVVCVCVCVLSCLCEQVCVRSVKYSEASNERHKTASVASKLGMCFFVAMVTNI